MDSSSKSAGATVKTGGLRSIENVKRSENRDPNVSIPGLKKVCRSQPIVKSGKSTAKKSISGSGKVDTNRLVSPLPKNNNNNKKKIRERKFVVVAKRKSNSGGGDEAVCEKCEKGKGKTNKCLCVAYESLRASQDEFFKKCGEKENEIDSVSTGIDCEGEKEMNDALPDVNDENGESGLKRSRDRLLEAARESVPAPGSGRVLHLVMAFEKLRMMPKTGVPEEKKEVEDDEKVKKWALPGLQQRPEASQSRVSSSSFTPPSDFFVTSESLGLDSGRSDSLDSSQGSVSTRTSTCGRKSRRSSIESSGTVTKTRWKRKQKKETSQKPFMLRTEQRGRSKEEEFMKKLQEMLEEEEKLRIPVAQGLPRTIDEPEFLIKPPVKENTRPVDLVLYTDTRAVERAEFDNQVVKKMNLIERYRMERERQQKLAEEEEIRRLRKELVPKAQPMPYFDRPFVPRRSMKQPTVPNDPKLHLPQNKKIKCHLSLDHSYAQLE